MLVMGQQRSFKLWETVRAIGISTAAVAAFVLTVVSIMGGLNDLRETDKAPSPPPPLASDGAFENCRELPKSQGDRILGMVDEGKLTSEEAGDLARSLACGAYKRSEEKAQAVNVAYAYRVQSSLMFLMTSRDPDVRAATAEAIRSDFDEADLQRLWKIAELPASETGRDTDYPYAAEPGYAQAAVASEQAIADDLRKAITALRSEPSSP